MQQNLSLLPLPLTQPFSFENPQAAEKKSKEESRVAMELRKHYEHAKNKADKLQASKT